MTHKNKKTSFGVFYNKYLSRIAPQYGVIPLISCFVFNCIIYWGTQLIDANRTKYDFTNAFDRKVPFVKEWIIIYVVCYLFWAINYILASREGNEHCFRFVTADLISRVICGIFFILIPTTNVRPEVVGTDFFSWLVQLIYFLDKPINLFPSIHCLVSWNCYMGIKKSKRLPKGYIIFSLIFAILVCISTQFTKQHYIIDLIGGIALSYLCFYISFHTDLYKYVERFFDRICHRIFESEFYYESKQKNP